MSRAGITAKVETRIEGGKLIFKYITPKPTPYHNLNGTVRVSEEAELAIRDKADETGISLRELASGAILVGLQHIEFE